MNTSPPVDDERDTRRAKATMVFTAALAFAVAPMFAPGLSGLDPGALPRPQYDAPILPASQTHLIWAVLCLWLLAHGAWGLAAHADDPDWDGARWPLFASLALGASWLSVAALFPLPATVEIWAMLGLALVALFAIPRDRERMLLFAPVALYAGWLTMAAFVALGLMLGGYGGIDAGLAVWPCLAGAAVLGCVVQLRLGNAPLYAAGLAWGFFGIAFAAIGRGDYTVALAALIGAGAVAHTAWRGMRAGA